MRGGHQHEPERRRQQVVEREEGMGGAAREQRAALVGVEPHPPGAVAGARAGRPKRVSTRGCLGTRTSGPVTMGASSSQRSATPPIQRRYEAASSPRPSAVSSIDRWRTARGRRPEGGRAGVPGATTAARDARGGAATGRATRAEGWMAEHTSCRKPGTVSSALRVPPPMVSAASRTTTERPASASVTAADSPFGPAPHDDGVVGRGSSAQRRGRPWLMASMRAMPRRIGAMYSQCPGGRCGLGAQAPASSSARRTRTLASGPGTPRWR